MVEKRLFLIDALALIYRSYQHSVTKNISNFTELSESTVYGFFEMLFNIRRMQNPSHLAVVFDVKKPTFRHVLYPKYKAHRRSMPPEIAKAIEYIKIALQCFDIQSIELEGFEADDIIGTLAKKAAKENYCVFMVTPDKDFYQLVDDSIFIYKLKKTGKDARIIDVTEVRNMYAVSNPSHLIDLFAFSGDRSDNIPAVNGFGKRGVKMLLSEYGNIDGMYKNLDKMSEKNREMLLNQKDAIMLSRKLVAIDVNVPVDIQLANLNLKIPESRQLEKLLNNKNLSFLYPLFSSSYS